MWLLTTSEIGFGVEPMSSIQTKVDVLAGAFDLIVPAVCILLAIVEGFAVAFASGLVLGVYLFVRYIGYKAGVYPPLPWDKKGWQAYGGE